MTTVQIDPPAPIPCDSAVLCALKCYVRRYGAHAHGSPGDSVGSYSATDTPLEEAMAAAWCYWIAATPKDRNPSEALLRWHDRQILCDLVQEWQTRQTDRDLAHHELAHDPAPAVNPWPITTNHTALEALDRFAAEGDSSRERAWDYWTDKAVTEMPPTRIGVAEEATEMVIAWARTAGYLPPAPVPAKTSARKRTTRKAS